MRLTFRGPHGFEKTQWAFLKFPAMDAGPGRYAYRVAALEGERAAQEMATIFEIKHTHGGWILWAGLRRSARSACCSPATSSTACSTWNGPQTAGPPKRG